VDAATGSFLEWEGHRTWYRLIGEISAGGKPPAILCHGGPGATHDYLESMVSLADSGRPCVFYDQLGNGHSQHLPDVPSEFWCPELFQRELHALIAHLGADAAYHVVGQSWGGMLAMEHAIDRPPGLRAIVVADSPASIPLWVAEANRLRADLPPHVQETLTRHEQNGTTDSPDYEEAVRVYYDRHLCRIPWPDCLERSFAQMAEDPTVYHTMNGPSEFHCIGSLKTWDITDRLSEIVAPTLLISGGYDEATPHIVGQIHTRIPDAQWELFEESAHVPHLEEPERFLDTVEAFLQTVD
jgi:L-proline amide hydrolase